MPSVYLSPSTQEFNEYYGGGNEEEYMNLVADAIIPYLNAAGISYTRNTPQMTAASSIAQSNAGNYDFHLAIHSNAAGDSAPGSARGVEIYYYPTSSRGKRAADIIAENYSLIYPLPNRIKTVPTTTLGEVARTRAPAVLVETAYHDNPEDSRWIKENIANIARTLALSLTQYFGIAFVEPTAPKTGYVVTQSGNLNIRKQPGLTSAVIARAPKGAPVTVLGKTGGWYSVEYNGKKGFASASYISVQS